MVIERNDKEVIIRLSNQINWEEIQLMINFFNYKETITKSKATQADIDKIASEINKTWWEENKSRFLR